MTPTGGTQAIDRAAQLLTLVVEADGPITFSELADETGLPRSTTSRLLAALEANRLLERSPGGDYRSGALFALYATRHDPYSQLARLAEPVLRRVGADTGETVNLAIPRGDSVVQIAQVDSTYMLSSRDWMQVDVPPHCSALGKVLYAWDALTLPDGRLEQRTDRSLADATALRRQLATIRRRGYAVTTSELEIGLDAIGVPVPGPDGDVIAALGISGPTTRLDGLTEQIGRQLIAHAETLSRVLRPPNRKSTVRRKGVA